MKEKENFMWVFLLTILITRGFVWFVPRDSFIYTDNLHHAIYGAVLLIVYFIFMKKPWAYYLLAIILGLIVDQITQAPFYFSDLLGRGLAPHSFWAYWSNYSVISTILAVIISIYLIKKYKK